MKELLLKLFKIESLLVKERKKTTDLALIVIDELKGIREAIETNNKAHGITKENGY